MDKNETALHRALRYEIAQNEQLREKLMEAENELHTLRLMVAEKKRNDVPA